MKDERTVMKSGMWLIVAIGALLVCAPAFANTTAALTVQGTVPGVLDISVTADTIGANLDLSANGTFVVASVTERSNKRAGYTVTLSSQNAAISASGMPVLKGSDVTNTDSVPYALTYGTVPVALTGGSAIISDVSTKTPAAGISKPLGISYVGQFLFEDTYTDTLTFTIAAK
jgi:hypothetical protein